MSARQRVFGPQIWHERDMTTSITRTQVLDGWTLATLAGDEEPRVRDIELAVRLGFERPRNIRRLISSLATAKKLSNIKQCYAAERTGGGRVASEYWLTEAQALKVIAKSETDVADAILDEVIAVFVAYRRGTLPSTVASSSSNTASIGDSPEALDRLRLAARRVNHARGYSIAKVYGFLRKTRKVNSPFAIAIGDIQSVLNDLERIERSVLSLGAGRAPKQLPANTAQASFKWN